MQNKRKLVGRRFEDFIRHRISLQLTIDEKIWHNLITDVRYHSLLDRRHRVRRKTDLSGGDLNIAYTPVSAALQRYVPHPE